MSQQDSEKALRNQVVDYDQTVKAILAFTAVVMCDGASRLPDSEFGLGRRMTTSPSNAISPDSEVTPDLVAQASSGYGVVAEVKRSLGRNREHWTKHARQLRKYDDNLLGWWTGDGAIGESDAVILVHASRSRQLKSFFEDLKVSNPGDVGPHSCIVEFIDSQETTHYYFFRREFGALRNRRLDEKLKESTQVPLDDVLSTFPAIRYYDSQPPLPRLLTELWTDVFPALAAEACFDESLGAYRVRASVREVTSEMQRAFGSGALVLDSRSTEFPRVRWIREAFDALVQFKLAEPPQDASDVYEIHYRLFRKDVLSRFIDLVTYPPRTRKGPKVEELKLLD